MVVLYNNIMQIPYHLVRFMQIQRGAKVLLVRVARGHPPAHQVHEPDDQEQQEVVQHEPGFGPANVCMPG